MKGITLSFVLAAMLIGAATAQEFDCSDKPNGFFPHPTDCNLYVVCNGGIAIIQDCPPGLWWNTALDACDFPENTVCSATSSTSTTDATSTTSGPSTETTSEVPTETTSVPIETTSVPTESTSVPTESTSVPTESTSVPTESTSTEIPTEPSSEIPTESTTPSTTTTPTTTTPTTTTTEAPPVHPRECPDEDDPDNIVRLPHETKCDEYYRCDNGIKVHFACANGLEFSVNRRFCFPPEEAGCSKCPTIGTEDELVRLPYDEDCKLYYLCIDQSPVLYQCSALLEFSRQWRECTMEANCTPISSTSTPSTTTPTTTTPTTTTPYTNTTTPTVPTSPTTLNTTTPYTNTTTPTVPASTTIHTSVYSPPAKSNSWFHWFS